MESRYVLPEDLGDQDHAPMTSTKNPTAVRDYNAAISSLTNAEELHAYLAQGDQTNYYLAEATVDAANLVAEMEANLDDVMDRWTPEQCGLR